MNKEFKIAKYFFISDFRTILMLEGLKDRMKNKEILRIFLN